MNRKIAYYFLKVTRLSDYQTFRCRYSSYADALAAVGVFLGDSLPDVMSIVAVY